MTHGNHDFQKKNFTTFIAALVIMVAPYIATAILTTKIYTNWELIKSKLKKFQNNIEILLDPISNNKSKAAALYFPPLLLIGCYVIHISSSADVIENFAVIFIVELLFIALLIHWVLKYKFLRNFTESYSFKFLMFTLLAALIWNAKYETSTLLNSNFGVDAGNFPFALSFGIFLKVSGSISIFVLIFAIILELLLFVVAIGFQLNTKREKNESLLLKILELASVFFMALTTFNNMDHYNRPFKFNKAVLAVAIDYDFIDNFPDCKKSSIKNKETKGVYISSLQS